MGWLERRRELRRLEEEHRKTNTEWDAAKKEMMAASHSGDAERIQKAMESDQRIGNIVIEQKLAIARLRKRLPGEQG